LPPIMTDGRLGSVIGLLETLAGSPTRPRMAQTATWTDRTDRDRTPTVPGQELAAVVTALGYGTKGHPPGGAQDPDAPGTGRGCLIPRGKATASRWERSVCSGRST
jgi:hypothetical protein